MRQWLKRLRGVVGMGLTWAIAWGLVGGLIMEGIVDPHGEIADMWPQLLAIPGFLGGVAFSLVLAVAERKHRFDELSVPRFAAWGAVGGTLLGVLALGAGIFPEATPAWLRAAMVIGPYGALNAISASGTLAIARRGAARSLEAGSGTDGGGVELPGNEPPGRLTS